MQPRGKTRAPVELRQRAPRLPEGFLHRVLGQRGVARDALAQHKQRPRVRIHQTAERSGVARTGGVDPAGVGFGHAGLDAGMRAMVSKATRDGRVVAMTCALPT